VAGAAIGSYHLLQSMGQGGMGEVWLAEQKQPVRRRVAIQLIKVGYEHALSSRAFRLRAPGAAIDGLPLHR
jgi:non-specific serine/threonine protein kinase/serine/threonine-protein kinase